jgi:modulator of FtsH protease HflC
MFEKKTTLPLGLAGLAILAYAFTFVVNQWEMALKLRLGEIIDTDYKPGLHFMIPGVHTVVKFDKRIQTLDATPQRFLTIEKKDVIVDSYAKWRISDVAQYFRSTGGNPMKTASLLSERINTSLRDEFGKRTIQEVISGERTEIMDLLRKDADEKASAIGVEVVDVRVKQIDLPPEVSESVYNRMRAERDRVARDLRAKGAEAAERIRADADRQRAVILAEAYRDAEQTRGTGDSKAIEIYAQAYSKNPEFYAFTRSLEAYRKSFGDSTNLLVIEPDSDFFRYFKDRKGR